MRKLLFAFIIFFCIPFSLLAQNKTIKGNVTDDAGKPAVGVNVGVKGNDKEKTQTNKDGDFSIPVAEAGKVTLVFTSTEFKTLNQTTDGTTALAVKLESKVTTDNEVIVVGYDVVKRKYNNVTVSTVDKTQLKDIPVNSAAEALTGRLAGVEVTTDEGQPGADATINIRGKTSITQDGSPLYIVDGVRLDDGLNSISPQDIDNIVVLKDAAATAIYGASGANGVFIITTKSGKNSKGKTTVSYNGQVGISQLSKELPVMDPYNFVAYQWERDKYTSPSDSNSINSYALTWNPDPNSPTDSSVTRFKGVRPTDWQHLVFGKRAFQQTHNISMTGGTEVTQYNLSFTDNEQDGIMLNTGYNRKLISFKLDHKLNDKAKVGFNVRYNSQIVDGSGTSDPGTTSLNNLRQSIRYAPVGAAADYYDPNIALETGGNSLTLINPILLQQQQYRKSTTSIVNMSGYVSYSFTKFLSFKSTLGYDINTLKQEAFDDTITVTAVQNGKHPVASIGNTVKTTLDNSNVLNFNFDEINPKSKFSNKNDLTALIGQELYLTYTKVDLLKGYYFPIGVTAKYALANMSFATPPANLPNLISTFELPSNVASFFAKVNYAYDKKYFISYSFRADGTSKFEYNPERQWGYFHSGQFAWKVIDENFMKKATFLSDLKFRASVGEAGNNRITDFAYLTQYVSSTGSVPNIRNLVYYLSGLGSAALEPALFSNDFLKWETTTSKNVGLDIALFKNRISLTTDVYWNKTTDLLINNPSVPTSTGYTKQFQNIGSTTNNGVEFQLSAIIIKGRKQSDFSWNANFNISFNKNKILNIGNAPPIQIASGAVGTANDFIIQPGAPVGAMYGYVSDGYYTTDDFVKGPFNTAGVIPKLKAGVANDQGVTGLAPQPGLMKLKSINGDSIVDASDRKIIGNPNPKFYGGLNQQFTYKNLDLSIFVNFSYGAQVLNANKLEFTNGYTPNANMLAIMNNRWVNIDQATGLQITDSSTLAGANKNAKLWAPLVTTSNNAFFPVSWSIEDGSFLRINNITLGYTFPTKLLKKINITRLRLFGTINNLAILTSYSGYDPEVNTRRSTPATPGVDYSAYPRSRTYLLGVNVSF